MEKSPVRSDPMLIFLRETGLQYASNWLALLWMTSLVSCNKIDNYLYLEISTFVSIVHLVKCG